MVANVARNLSDAGKPHDGNADQGGDSPALGQGWRSTADLGDTGKPRNVDVEQGGKAPDLGQGWVSLANPDMQAYLKFDDQ